MPKNVLAVDEIQRVEYYRGLLRNRYEFWGTVSPYKALDMSQNISPDLVLTALDFPHYVLHHPQPIDGPELIRRVHNINKKIKFIVCDDSPESQVEDILRGLKAKNIDVEYVRFQNISDNLALLVRSLIEE